MFNELLKISLSTSVIIMTLIILKPVLNKRYTARWRYVAWIILALRLLIPITISAPVSPFQIQTPVIETVNQANIQEYEPVNLNQKQAIESSQSLNTQGSAIQKQPSAGYGLSYIKAAEIIWLLGAAVYSIYQLAIYITFRAKLKQGHSFDPPENIHMLLKQAGDDYRLSKLPGVTITSAVDTPVLAGLLKPVLYLPKQEFNDCQLSFIIRHELVHYKRKDLWYKLILVMANGIHWFNPIVHIMAKQAIKDIELSCDDSVCSNLDNTGREQYGLTILNTLPRKGGLTPIMTTQFGSSKKNVKKRLNNLFDFRKKRKGITAIAVLIAFTAIFAGMFTSGTASASNEPANIYRLPHSARLDGGNTLTFGPYELKSTETYVIMLTWAEGGTKQLNICNYNNQSNLEKRYNITSGDSLEITPPADGLYTIKFDDGTAMTNIAYSFYKKDAHPVRGGLASAFLPYAEHGLSYNAESNTAQFENKPVKLFVAYQTGNTNAFELNWHNGEIEDGIYVQAEKDNYGNITGLKLLDSEDSIVQSILNVYKGVQNNSGIKTDELVMYYTLDGNNIIEELGITAQDMTKSQAPEQIKRWAEICDKRSGGAFLLRLQTDKGYDTYFYYKYGGRYPWTIEADGNRILIKLFDNDKSTGDGYNLMHFTSPENYESIEILIDGKPLETNQTALIDERSSAEGSVYYESVGINFPDNKGGHPYIKDIITNSTNKRIVSIDRGMLAYDKNGSPLKIYWNGMDSSSPLSYSFIYDWGTENIAPGETLDDDGGWSLINLKGQAETDKYYQIEYVLFNFKKITFEDGSIWENPEFDNWLKKYEAKVINVNELDNYYPYQCIID